MGLTWYSGLSAAALALSVLVWCRLARSRPGLGGVYLGALAGAIVGAKLAFLLAEGWHYRGDMVALLTGRSVSGALLGGYAGVELAKRLLRRPGSTGDLFAIAVPLGLIVGRVGCLVQGCCPGVECGPHWWTIADAHGAPRWPAVPTEMVFNAAFLLWALAATGRRWLPTNRFHVYLIAYGLFRFAHEFVRDDARWFGSFGGYHVVALALIALGVARWRVTPPPGTPDASASASPPSPRPA